MGVDMDNEKLARQMKADWDRRVSHDYRFWMSDGVSSDEAMWTSGERDLTALTKGLPEQLGCTVLELGCGVGRILKAALPRFKQVIGVDVSSKAIDKARALLPQSPRLTLIAGDGLTLQPIADSTVDLVVSFAAISSIPTEVIGGYFREMHRVLVPNGRARLQVYLGREQAVTRSDTLHLRCYQRENFIKAVDAAGFKVESIEQLDLGFEVSSSEQGFEAVVVSLLRVERTPASAAEICGLLLPLGEPETSAGSADLECYMTVNYAKQLLVQGDIDRARDALAYAADLSATVSIDVRDMLDRLVAECQRRERASGGAAGEMTIMAPEVDTSVYARNIAVIERRFPEIAAKLAVFSASSDGEIELRQTGEGPALYFRGQCLDHPQKPRSAAETWMRRALKERKCAFVDHLVVVGVGAGYHLEVAVAESNGRAVSLVEPSLALLKKALETRDLSRTLEELKQLAVGDCLPLGEGQSELIVRPQTQALFGEYVAAIKSKFFGVRGISALHPSIGVLGPIMGGTLPITAYTTRALTSLDQRCREYDMSTFAPGFGAIDKLIFDRFRSAAVHGQYIQMVSRVVLETLIEKPVDVLICMAQAPISAEALTELRRRGVITVMWFLEDYLRFTYWKELGRYFDFMFTIQKGRCLEAIREAGAGVVHYLPAACDPGIHTPQQLTAEERARWGSPVSFVGAGYHNRQQMFASLADMPFKIWGTEWPDCRPFDKLVQESGRRLTPVEYTKIFNSTDVNLNLHSSTERDGVEPNGDFVNPRVFELASTGAFQLVDERELLPELFTPGVEVATFRNLSEMKEKIDYYLRHPEERRKMAEAARARALSQHTYAHRIKEMLSVIYNSRYEELRRKEENGPWARMLSRAQPHSELHARCKRAFDRGEEANLDGLVSDIMTGKGKLTDTEMKLLFMFHVRKQIVRAKVEELGDKAPKGVV